jgi:hypothetical protein
MSRRCEEDDCRKWAFSGTKYCLTHKHSARKRQSKSLQDAIAIEKLEIAEERGLVKQKEVIDLQRRSLVGSAGDLQAANAGSSESEKPSQPVSVTVHTPGGEKIVLALEQRDTVLCVKAAVASNVGIDTRDQKIFHPEREKELQDDVSLQSLCGCKPSLATLRAGLSSAEIELLVLVDVNQQRYVLEDKVGFRNIHTKSRGYFGSDKVLVDFPPSQGIQINMMPIVLGDLASIPSEYRHYGNVLRQCPAWKSALAGTKASFQGEDAAKEKLLRQVPWLLDAPASVLAHLVPVLRMVKLAPGALVYEEGEPGRSMFLIKRGIVETTRSTNVDANNSIRGADCLPTPESSFFGDKGLIGATEVRKETVAASAACPVELWELTEPNFKSCCVKIPAFAKSLNITITDLPQVCNAYLTINEGLVEKGQTQRRGGLHCESPGMLVERGTMEKGTTTHHDPFGSGEYTRTSPYADRFHGGIYMASSVADSCRVWDVQIDPEGIGHLGDIEHLRSSLPIQPSLLSELGAGELVWMTDCTPHEALPMKEGQKRQFFRLVVGPLGVWHAQHNTANPLGLQPAAPISGENKFDGGT